MWQWEERKQQTTTLIQSPEVTYFNCACRTRSVTLHRRNAPPTAKKRNDWFWLGPFNNAMQLISIPYSNHFMLTTSEWVRGRMCAQNCQESLARVLLWNWQPMSHLLQKEQRSLRVIFLYAMKSFSQPGTLKWSKQHKKWVEKQSQPIIGEHRMPKTQLPSIKTSLWSW